jgi:1-phosphofructokinase
VVASSLQTDSEPVHAEDQGRADVSVFWPAPLLTITIESTADGDEELHLHPGGQGFWIARMTNVLGADVVVCAPFGGETGIVLGHLLDEMSVRVRAISVPAASGAYIHDRRSSERREIWEGEHGVLGRHELDELYSATLAEALAAGVCVLAGTNRHESIEPDTYRRLAADLGANGVRVIADLSGDELSAALEGSPYLVKLSDEELVRGGFAGDDGEETVAEGIERLLARGAKNVVASRGDKGSIAVLEGTWYEVRAPSMEAVDPRGAGDSMTAALAVAAARDLDAESSLRLAAAAGALNVTRHGLGSGRADAIAQLTANVEVTAVDERTPR